jgi:signal transduction histidine kinase
MKSTFLATVSHELRTPLTAVIGFAEVLKRGFDQVSAEQREVLVEHIYEQGRRLGVLIEDLLDATRVEFGGLRVKPSAQDVAEIAARVSVSFEGMPNPIVLRIPLDLPPVFGDQARLEQVLTNLVGNAMKHSPAGSPVEVRADVDGTDHVAISVVDYGKGIDPAFLAHVFEPFAQATTSGSREGGLGLGLYIVRGLVEAMGGTIDARSEVGRGSEFITRLPRAPSE